MRRVLGMWVGADVDPTLLGAGWTVHRQPVSRISWTEVGRRDLIVARLDRARLMEFTAEWERHDPRTPLLAVVDEDVTVPEVLQVVRAGACDVLVAPVDEEQARAALIRLHRAAGPELPLVEVARTAHADDLPFGDGALLLPTLWAALMSPDGDMDAVVEVIGRSPRLTAKTLQAANLASFRSSRPARSLRDASVRLGVRKLALVAHDASMASAYELSCFRALGAQLWRNATACTRGAAAIARLAAGVDPYVAQLYALLHNVGEIAILSHVCAQPVRGREEPGFERRLCEVIATEHETVGARILDEMGAPAGVRQFTQCHHDPRRLAELGETARIGQTVMLAWELAHEAGFSYDRHGAGVSVHAMCAALGITESAARAAFIDAHEGVS